MKEKTHLFHRRAVLSVASAATLHGLVGSAWGDAPHAPPPGGSYDPGKVMAPSEQMMHFTIRLEFPTGEATARTGTGFFFGFLPNKDRVNIGIVSNKHVFLGDNYKTSPQWSNCKVTFIIKDQEGQPSKALYYANLIDIEKHLILYPTEDLAVLMFDGYLSNLKGAQIDPFFFTLLPDLVPTDDVIAALTPLEGVLTVGYPGQLWDNINDLPVFHRGNTASPLNVDFQGHKAFLVDFTTWFGASGSPMFLYEEGGWFDTKQHNYTLGGVRFMLVGIVYGVATETLNGDVIIVQAPTNTSENPVRTVEGIPSNLGACIKSAMVLDFEPLLIAKGYNAAPDYKIRSNLKL